MNSKTPIPRLSIMIGILITFVITLIIFVSTAKAEYIRIQFDFALKIPLTKEQEDKLVILKTAIADLKVDMETIISPDGKVEENTTKTHICKHDEGGSCIEEKDIASTDITKINPTPKSTPK